MQQPEISIHPLIGRLRCFLIRQVPQHFSLCILIHTINCKLIKLHRHHPPGYSDSNSDPASSNIYLRWEVTKEQTAYLYHRILTSAGYSASSVEKYHYHSDCHRHIRGSLILIAGVLAILKYRNHGVPAKVAIIRNKVLVNDLFNFQAKRLPFLLSGMNPFTHLDKGV